MSIATERKLTVDEFLAWAQLQEGQYELYAGRVYLMAPERAGHARVKYKVHKELDRAISEAGLACHMMPDGMTVRVDVDTAHEPDALVYCGPEVGADVVEIANPVLVVEVLSPSTRHIDAAAKLSGYFRVRSVQHYLIVDPERRTVILHSRQADATILTRLATSGVLRLDPPGFSVDLGGILS